MDRKIDESELGLPSISPVCVFCARLNAAQRRRCAAFGDKDIPLEIWEGQNTHRAPYPGDHGLQFMSWSEGLTLEEMEKGVR
jgi:hypothetical protein